MCVKPGGDVWGQWRLLVNRKVPLFTSDTSAVLDISIVWYVHVYMHSQSTEMSKGILYLHV